MVAVNGIPMNVYAGGNAAGAVAFSLAAPPRRDRLRQFAAEQWEIDMRSGRDHIVARTSRSMSRDAMLDEAIEMTHRALDLTSIEELDHIATSAPADNHVILLNDGRKVTVTYYAVIDFPIEMNVSLEVRRANGTVEQPPAPVVPKWTPAFRFHRLSQSSRDLFGAFRNLYLGLEAVLDQLWPKRRSEGEKAWLLRAVIAAGAKVDLAKIATPGAPNATQDLVDQLYDVRVHLFHAKTGRTLIPDERVSYLKVAKTYPVLVSLWTEIVRQWLGLSRGGGVITYQGFKMLEAINVARLINRGQPRTEFS